MSSDQLVELWCRKAGDEIAIYTKLIGNDQIRANFPSITLYGGIIHILYLQFNS